MTGRARAGAVLALALALLTAWATPAPARAAATLDLVLPLKANDAGLKTFALAVSTPGSPLYGAYEPVAALARRFGAEPQSAAAVMRYLQGRGARNVRLSPTRMYVEASMTRAQALHAFGAHAASSTLHGLITGVVGLDPRPVARAAVRQAPSAYQPRTGTATGCSAGRQARGFAPNQYLAAYGYDPLHDAGLRGHAERVALIEIDGFKRSDITTFGRCFGLHVPPLHTFTVGLGHSLPPGGETTLDVELVTAAAPRLASLDVYENRGDAAHVLQSFTAPLVSPGAKPEVVSISLGICEPALFSTLGPSGIQAAERDLELAAATGISVLAATGDSGSSSCVRTDGSVIARTAVSYPASSPFITAVGGTNLTLDGANHIVGEDVWNDAALHTAAGGGGVSALFNRPSYQKGVVPVNARELPDVSMLADLVPGYAIYCTARGEGVCHGWTSVGGTSAAAPLLAGGLALVDQDLDRHGREFLGLANPLLYHLGKSSVFHDVTAIGNDLGPFLSGGGAPLGCCTAGPGFDDASGWGSPNLAAFDAAARRLVAPAPDLVLSLPAGQRPIAHRGLLARLSCSERCRAYVSGNLVYSTTSGSAIRSPTVRFTRAGIELLELAFTNRQVSQLRAAVRAHGTAFAEVFGIALDAHGNPIRVTPGAVLRFRR